MKKITLYYGLKLKQLITFDIRVIFDLIFVLSDMDWEILGQPRFVDHNQVVDFEISKSGQHFLYN